MSTALVGFFLGGAALSTLVRIGWKVDRLADDVRRIARREANR